MKVESNGWKGRLQRWLPMFLVAALVRAFYWAVIFPTWKPQADADQYVRLARALADGQGFSLVYPQLEMHATAFRPPLYPVLLAPGAWLFGNALWPIRLTNLLLGSLVVVLIGVLAARVGGRRAGLFAAGVAAIYPPLIANDTVSLTEPLALALLLGAVLLVDDDHPVWAGVAVGGLLLTRPNGYLVLVVLAVWAALRLGWRRSAALVGATLLVFVPWLVRNRVQVGTWRPTTSDGLTLAAVYGLPGQRAGHFVDPVFSPAYGDLDHRLAQFDEASWNTKLTKEAIDGVKSNPRYVGHVVKDNVQGFFELRPSLNDWPELNDGRNMGFRSDTLPLFYVVTVLGLIGLVRHRRDPRVIVVAVLVAQFVLLSIFLVAPPRLRAPFDVAMCIGAGLCIAQIVDGRRSARTPGSAGAPGLAGDGEGPVAADGERGDVHATRVVLAL